MSIVERRFQLTGLNDITGISLICVESRSGVKRKTLAMMPGVPEYVHGGILRTFGLTRENRRPLRHMIQMSEVAERCQLSL